MNDVLDFLGIVRNLAQFYLWAMFLAAAALWVADSRKRSSGRVHQLESEVRKAA